MDPLLLSLALQALVALAVTLSLMLVADHYMKEDDDP